jgi:RNA polymerase sigma factor (sigma-70 family)
MDPDTDLGGSAERFPATHRTLVRAAASPDPAHRQQALHDLIAVYWKPVYKYLRVKWKLANEDAKDLTQGFFSQVLEKDMFGRFDPTRARFRTYVRLCADGYVARERQAAGRLKRGGGVQLQSLDFAAADGELAHQPLAVSTDPEAFFHQEWVRRLFGLAVEELRRECTAAGKDHQFALFERYDLNGPSQGERLTYAQLGQEFGLPATQVTNYLAATRRRFRTLVLERLRTVSGSEEEFRQEAQNLFGVDVP